MLQENAEFLAVDGLNLQATRVSAAQDQNSNQNPLNQMQQNFITLNAPFYEEANDEAELPGPSNQDHNIQHNIHLYNDSNDEV
ncbi:unnamed protein product [Onchocerca ochengi]|nr:unnamed protein product [Onchocerca ochengi]